jgi:hypothetical protein
MRVREVSILLNARLTTRRRTARNGFPTRLMGCFTLDLNTDLRAGSAKDSPWVPQSTIVMIIPTKIRM